MPEPLTDAYLAEIQARVDAARPLPWKTTQHDMDGLPLGFGPFSWVEAWTTEEIAPNIDFCNKARTDVPNLLAEVARLKARLAERAAAAPSGLCGRALATGQPCPDHPAKGYPPALPWAAQMDADDLEGFLSDLATAADAEDDLTTLAAVEKTIAEWRLIAEATHAQRTAPGPDGGASDAG